MRKDREQLATLAPMPGNRAPAADVFSRSGLPASSPVQPVAIPGDAVRVSGASALLRSGTLLALLLRKPGSLAFDSVRRSDRVLKQSAANVMPAPPVISTTSMNDGTVGEVYVAGGIAWSGAQGGSWSVVSGTLPTGLGQSAGNLYGTPTEAGAFDFTLRYTDPYGQYDDQAFTVTIAASEYLNDPLTNGDQVTTTKAGGSAWSYDGNGAYYDGASAGFGTLYWEDADSPAEDADFTLTVAPKYSIASQQIMIEVLLNGTPGGSSRNSYGIRHSGTNLVLYRYDPSNGEITLDSATVANLTNTAITYNVYVNDNGDGTHDLVVSMDATPVATATNITHPGTTGTDTGIRWYAPGSGYAVTLKDALGV